MIKAASWLILFIGLSTTHLAIAGRTRRGTIVIVVEGDAEAEREITGSILPKLTIQPPEDLLTALASQGIRGSACDALALPRTRQRALLAMRKAMKEVGAAAVLTVQLRRGKAGAREMHVILLLSTQTEPMIEEDIVVPRGEKATPRLAPLLSVSLQDLSPSPPSAVDPESAAPPPATGAPSPPSARAADTAASGEQSSKRARKKKEIVEETEVTEERDEPVASPEKDAVSKKRGKLLVSNAFIVADAGLGVASRKLEYSDAVAGSLRNHAVSAMGVYGVGLEIYPAVSSGSAVAKDIGLVGRFASSFEVESTTKDGGHSARGSFKRYALGVRGRILAGDKKDGVLIGLEGTYGVWAFAFSGLDNVVNDALAVEYKHFRVGADARVPWGSLALLGGAGYMNVSSAGPFSDRFPHASIQGVDAKLGGAYAVGSQVAVRALVTYARIFSSAHPDLDAPYIAGGALDQYFVFDLGASAIF
jgi:hypothetical protein